jgi:penicillin-binding protein 1C
LLVAAVLLALRLAPRTPLADLSPYSSAVYTQDGTLLRLTTAKDEQYRLWTPLNDIAPAMREAALMYEDRWYYAHPGVNPAAIVRSAYATFSGERRQGGSTITMQLARKVYGIDSATVSGKVQQIGAALWLEARYGKREILEAYLNFVPYGGNVEGVGAASLAYFNKRAAELTLPEALTLAVIPQNPAARGGKAHAPKLLEARSRMANIWLTQHPGDERLGATHVPAMKTTAQLPFKAPHLANHLLKEAKGEIFSTLDARMQATLERSIAQRLDTLRPQGVKNAAALLLDTETMHVKALVGSANFFDADIDGQVNGTLAKRSPGSTLKPFIYALAFDQGVLTPMTVLKDAPTAFGPFSPENFDGRFVGPITAQEALTRSRNIPAVQVASRLTRPSLYDFLQTSGVSQMASEKHYGLALTLGGGEVTMEELARMYAVLANGGELRPIQYACGSLSRNSPHCRPREPPIRVAMSGDPFSSVQEVGKKMDSRFRGNDMRKVSHRGAAIAVEASASNESSVQSHHRLLSPESSFVTLKMLETNPRPDTGQPAQPPVAWKTGTSWGFRDAWTAGVFGKYVLVVWVGNFDGASNAALIGVSAAAPMFFHIVDALRHERVIEETAPRLPPRRLTRVEVCAATGDLPNADCPQRVATWYLPGVSPIKVSRLHQRLLIDKRTGEAVCEENAHTQWQTVEAWPTDMQRLFREAGMPRRAAPEAPNCDGASNASHSKPQLRTASDNTSAPQIVSPLRAVTYTARLSHPTPIPLKAEGAHGRGKQFWFADESYLGETQAGESLQWLPPKAGRFTLRVVDAAGRADSRELAVEVVP